MTTVEDAIGAGLVGARLWFYANYHCNLACTYCLTESTPRAPRRRLAPERMLDLARQAAALGFREIGVTGGEPFLEPALPRTLAALADVLPVLVLTNGTLFVGDRLDRADAVLGKPVSFQISLDSADPDLNDLARGPENFAKVVEVVPRMVARGHRVRIASTGGAPDAEAQERLCALHRSLGVPDEDHVVRPVVRRGRGASVDGAVPAGSAELYPELTITADGAFWSPFAPTVVDDHVDIDLLVSRTVDPLRVPAQRLVSLAAGLPPGGDVAMNIR